IIEEGKSGGGGLASLAGQFGFDLGGISGGNGLLSDDNVAVFLKSTSLARKTLLTPYDSALSMSLADRYAEISGFSKKWRRKERLASDVSFPYNSAKPFSRLQDSLLQVVVSDILKKGLFIDKPDKKATVVEVIVTSKDEFFSQLFCQRLVSLAIERYVAGKSRRQALNVERLQRRADSIGVLLNSRTFATAIAQERILDVNPAFKTSTVNAEVTSRDKSMLATIYGEVVKNLEISKVALAQETPSIQVIDEVQTPLKADKANKILAILIGGVLAMCAAIALLSLKLLMRM
ncbi:MAG: hypothetical protein J7497_13510, partial [Chitinophagaceae bacterium]|nr:hypothetical protein [Chitinophagaceae bacterium]